MGRPTLNPLCIICRLHIVGETLVDVNHCLLALPGTKLEDIERVISHPQVKRGHRKSLPAAL